MKHGISSSQRKIRVALPFRSSVLSWPAWLRVVAVLPICVILWLGVVWALAENIA